MRITNGQLAKIITILLTNPDSGEVDSMERFESFVNDLAQVVCDHCGGNVVSPAEHCSAHEFADSYALTIEPSESSPENGIWTSANKVQILSGHLGCDGIDLRAVFSVPVGATVDQKDAAFLAALAQQADIDYIQMGQMAPADEPPVMDEVRIGEEGLLVTLDGEEIVGTFEILPGVAFVSGATRLIDGSIDPIYQGQTDIDYDAQKSCRNGQNERIFVTASDKHVPTSQVKLIPYK